MAGLACCGPRAVALTVRWRARKAPRAMVPPHLPLMTSWRQWRLPMRPAALCHHRPPVSSASPRPSANSDLPSVARCCGQLWQLLSPERHSWARVQGSLVTPVLPLSGLLEVPRRLLLLLLLLLLWLWLRQ